MKRFDVIRPERRASAASPRSRGALALLLLAACATAKGAQKPQPLPTPASEDNQTNAAPDFRAKQPPPLPATHPFAAPVPVERQLACGARLLVVENHALPLVSVEVALEAGVDAEPLGKRGLAGYVARMLSEGTRERGALGLAIAEEQLAAQIDARAAADSIRIDLQALSQLLPQSLDLLAEVVREPAFRQGDAERVRGILLTELAAKKGQPAALAKDELSSLLYGRHHPWGLPAGGTPKTIKSITVEDLVRFHDAWFVPDDAVLTVVGDVTPDQAKALLDKSFAGWKARKLPARPPESFPAETARSIALADVPGASQSQVWIGWRTLSAKDPDAVTLLVANNVLGGLFTSRLNMNLREDKAYSYGVRSRVEFDGDTGRLVASGGMVAKHTADAVAEMEKELSRFSNGEVSGEELARAKAALIRGLPAKLETNRSVASSLADLVLEGLPLDYYAKLPAMVNAVGKADVARVCKRLVTPERWPIVIVGPRQTSEQELAKLGLGKLAVVAE